MNLKTSTSDKKKGELLLPILLILAFLFLILKAKTSFFPIILSIALAYLIDPIILHFETKGFKRIYTISALYIIVGTVVFFLGRYLFSTLASQTTDLKTHWPEYLEKLKTVYFNIETKTLALFPFLEPYFSWDALYPKILSLGEKIPNIVLGAIPALTLFFLVPFFTFFLLLDGKKIIDAFLDILPSKTAETALYIISQTDESLGNYIRGILLEATTLFVLAFIGLTFMDFEYAGAISFIIGITSLVPYLGVIIGAIASSTAAYIQFGTVISIVKVLLFFTALKIVDDTFLVPNILKRAVRIHPIIIVFVLMAGGELFGIWGVVFAMPVACMAKVILSIAIELHRSAFDWKPKPHPTRISIPYV